MCEDTRDDLGLAPYSDLNRRHFAILTLAGAAAGLAPGAAFAQSPNVVERDVSIRTPDGTCDAVVFHPEGRGSWPGVLLWPDIYGLRPAKRDMGRRLAGSGYVVLVVNPYYRTAKAPEMAGLNMQVPEQQARRQAARAAMTTEAIDRDAVAFVRWLDALPQTSNAKVGVQGYCMGGPLSFRTAAAMPGRVGAVGSFHGSGMVTDEPSSPHLLIPKTNARFLVAIAKNDDASRPNEKAALREAIYKAGKPAMVEVYGGNHGWCVPDSAQHHQAEAERAWASLLDIYQRSLV